MARRANCKLIPVDMGIKDFSPQPGVLNRRVANGTGDISKGPAMTREQAILAGALLVKDCKEQDVSLLATGEMGIGNTTTASAVASVLLGCEPEAITGRGAGLSDEGLARKKAAICRAIQINQPNPADPLDVLAKLGGFDIAGMCGAFLGGAAFGGFGAYGRSDRCGGSSSSGASLLGCGQDDSGQPCVGGACGRAAAECTGQAPPDYCRASPG